MIAPVSYTHLDVYKRQGLNRSLFDYLCFLTIGLNSNIAIISNDGIILYLNYAEALNEYYETPPKEAFDAVLKVRERSGMPGFPSTCLLYTSRCV